jgi:hypothetical protein
MSAQGPTQSAQMPGLSSGELASLQARQMQPGSESEDLSDLFTQALGGILSKGLSLVSSVVGFGKPNFESVGSTSALPDMAPAAAIPAQKNIMPSIGTPNGAGAKLFDKLFVKNAVPNVSAPSIEAGAPVDAPAPPIPISEIVGNFDGPRFSMSDVQGSSVSPNVGLGGGRGFELS